MKLPDNWKNLWNDDGFIANLTGLVKTVNGIASLILIALAIYLPYQLILEIRSWF
jgi:hypothetical protein